MIVVADMRWRSPGTSPELAAVAGTRTRSREVLTSEVADAAANFLACGK